jgi:WD40 repeat protein
LLVVAATGFAQQPELVLPTGHSDRIRFGEFSADGRYMISAGDDRSINVWETFTGIKIKSLSPGSGKIVELIFIPGGRGILARTDSSLRVWSFPEYRSVVSLENVKDAGVSPRGNFITLVYYNGKVEKRMVADGKPAWEKKLGAQFAPVVREDENLLAFFSTSELVLLKSNGTEFKRLPVEKGVEALFVPGDSLITVIDSSRIRQINYHNNERREIAPTGSRFFASPGRRFFINADYFDPFLTVVDLYTGIQFDFGGVHSKYDTLAVPDSNDGYRIVNGSVPISLPSMRESFNGAVVSNDGHFLSAFEKFWNLEHPDSSYELPFTPETASFRGNFSPDGKFLLIQTALSQLSLWDLDSRKFIAQYKGTATEISTADIDSSGRVVAAVEGKNCRLVSLETGKSLFVLAGHTATIGSARFSPDGKKLLTNSYDSTACLWDVDSGILLERMKGHHYELNPVYFKPSGEIYKQELRKEISDYFDLDSNEEKSIEVLIPVSNPANLCMAQGRSGKHVIVNIPQAYVTYLSNSPLQINDLRVSNISPDETLFATTEPDTDSVFVGDVNSGKWIFRGSLQTVNGHQYNYGIIQLIFSADNRWLFAVDLQNIIHILDVKNGFKKKATLAGNEVRVPFKGDYFLVVNGGRIDVLDGKTLSPVYSYISMGDDDLLVIDPQMRFDGTPGARKQLYFTCNSEVIGLEQYKEKLWVPGLAERISRHEQIYNQGIADLQICGFTPQVNPSRDSRTSYEYEIKPGKGGLGDISVFVNGIEVKKLAQRDLRKKDDYFLMKLDPAEVQSYFTSYNENVVTVKAFVADNSISSRGLSRVDTSSGKNAEAPNFYGVMVGVSDYKGEELDLKYAAKDASDLAKAISASARKLLNTDGREHVFMYELTTNRERYRLPEKLAIRQTLEEISARASPNDILMIFFAGHGVLQGKDKQFYFLTAEAAKASTSIEIEAAGISTSELTDWIRPSKLKAQKRILIFDACNSGQAINDLVKVGDPSQGYIAARNEDRGQQIKQIEQLNERAGFTILSASASDQSAYELGNYAQGLLTYALLKSIKEKPEILTQGMFLDVSRWFYAAGNFVEELIRKHAARQQPQFISNTNFVIGKVDAEVLASIKLPNEKPIFGTSIVVNMSGNRDDLRLSRMLNAELSSISSQAEGKLIYIPDHESKDTYLVNGTYSINDSTITIELVFTRGEELIATKKFEGRKDALNILMSEFRSYLDSFLK